MTNKNKPAVAAALAAHQVNQLASVGAYFANTLNEPTEDETLWELPQDSGCGKDCVAAIDAAAAFLVHIKVAGDDVHSPQVIRMCDMVCQVYWHG